MIDNIGDNLDYFIQNTKTVLQAQLLQKLHYTAAATLDRATYLLIENGKGDRVQELIDHYRKEKG